MSDHEAHVDSGNHNQDVYHNAFDAEVREALKQEDSEAWNNVTAELLTIVAVGVAFFAFIVWIIAA
ncbi:MAG: hypothetical protein ACKOBW_10695 [Planctomycetota bacterium]